MRTDHDTLVQLAVYILNYLKEAGLVEFHSTVRPQLLDALTAELNVSFATDEDIKEQAIEEVQEKMGDDYLIEDITENEMFNHARKEIIKSFQGEQIGGLYLAESLHQAAGRVRDFLMDNDFIEDVFGTDEELIDFLVSKLRHFQPKKTVA